MCRCTHFDETSSCHKVAPVDRPVSTANSCGRKPMVRQVRSGPVFVCLFFVTVQMSIIRRNGDGKLSHSFSHSPVQTHYEEHEQCQTTSTETHPAADTSWRCDRKSLSRAGTEQLARDLPHRIPTADIGAVGIWLPDLAHLCCCHNFFRVRPPFWDHTSLASEGASGVGKQ